MTRYRVVAPPWQRPADPRPTGVERLLLEGKAPLTDAQADDGETVPDFEPAPLLDQLGTDLPCGTPLARLAAEAGPRLEGSRRDEVRRLLEPPRLAAADELLLTSDGLVLRFDQSVTSRHSLSRRDVDGTGAPDAAEALTAETALVVARLAEDVGWSRDLGGGGPLPIIPAASAHAEGRHVAEGVPHVVVPRQLAGAQRLHALAHQLAHAALHALEPEAPIGWEEAAAGFLARRAVTAITGRPWRDAAGREAAHASRALGSPGLISSRDDADFFAWLDESGGLADGWLGELWLEIGRRLEIERSAGRAVSAPLARETAALALDELLAREGGAAATSLGDAVASYHRARLEADLLARAGEIPVDAVLAGHPSEIVLAGSDLPSFGHLRYALETPRAGGLRLAFEGDERTEAWVFSLLADGRLVRHALADGETFGGQLLLPGSRLLRVVVLLMAPEIPGDAAAWADDGPLPGGDELRLTVESDPSYPFAMAEIAAEAEAERVRLDWTTSSEEDLVGWHVERASRPAGPWRRITGVPFPARSRTGQRASYTLVDTNVAPSSRQLYRAVAVTSTGLVERSAVVSVRTLPRGPRLEAQPGSRPRR